MPDEEAGKWGCLIWFLDDELVMNMDGESLKKRGFGGKLRLIPVTS